MERYQMGLRRQRRVWRLNLSAAAQRLDSDENERIAGPGPAEFGSSGMSHLSSPNVGHSLPSGGIEPRCASVLSCICIVIVIIVIVIEFGFLFSLDSESCPGCSGGFG